MSIQNNSEIEKLLYKLVFQFSIYTLGSNELLEPYLVSINKSLKQGLNHKLLTPELIELSKKLTSVSRQLPSENTLSAVNQQQEVYLIEQLNHLLSKTNIPSKYQKQYGLLQKKVNAKYTDEGSLRKTIDQTISLLFSIKGEASSEQSEVESFLTNISKHFIMLGEQTIDVSKANKLSLENSKSLNNVISSQVDNIKNSSANAQELSSLKENITQHLQELSFQFQEHQESEKNQLFDTQKQLDQMSKKLQELEVEADSLRSNLKIAHNRALSDALTGLPNRMAYDDRVLIEYSRWNRYKPPLSLIIWDIDLFKVINDTYGHKAGDKTLALVAHLLSQNCRETDFIARYGGEEFVMLLPNTTSKQALIVAEKIRPIIARSGFNYQGESIKLTISCGISEFLENDKHEGVFERADQALYLSKEQGRNKCSIIDKSSSSFE